MPASEGNDDPVPPVLHRYRSANNHAELADALGWALGHSCAVIFNRFTWKHRGSVVWKVIRFFNRRAYDEHHYRTNVVWSEAANYLSRYTAHTLASALPRDQAEQLARNARTYAGQLFVQLLQLGPDDTDAFSRVFAERCSDLSTAIVGVDVDEGLRIWEQAQVAGYGREWDLAESVHVMHGCIDAPRFLRLHDFVERWRETAQPTIGTPPG